MSNFVSLHNQTVYSLLDSLCSVQGLFDRAKELNQPAVAITDHGSLAAAWDALKVSKKTGVKLIIGCECYFTDDADSVFQHLSHLILIAKNDIGYKNLLTINKLAFDQGIVAGSKVYPLVDWKLLEQYNEGLICLTACGNGIVSQDLAAGNTHLAEEKLLKLKSLFGENLGIEVLANNMKRNATARTFEIDQKFLNRRLVKLADKLNIKAVAACNTHYLKPEEYDTHDVLLSIGAKSPRYSNFRLKYNVNDFYLKSETEMISFFTRNFGKEKAEELVFNSKFFSDMCEFPEWIDPKYSNPSGKELPIFPVKDEPDYDQFKIWQLSQDTKIQNLDEDKAYLRFTVEKTFNKKIQEDNIPNKLIHEYKERINKELEVFEELDISSYMLITADFLNYARKNNIAVGPGRGCLFGDTEILTDTGFKQLKDIEINDKVYTHTGELQKVFNKFEYDVDEECLEIKSDNSFDNLILTKDHKVYVRVAKETKRYIEYKNKKNKSLNKIKRWEYSDPKWIKACNLKYADEIFTPNLVRNIDEKNIFNNDTIDLSEYCNHHTLSIKNDYIIQKIYKTNNMSIRNISKRSGLARNVIRNIIKGNGSDKSVKILKDYCLKNNVAYKDVIDCNNFYLKKINKKINTKDLLYWIGRWVGDGWILKNKNSAFITGIAFHKNDVIGQNKFKSFLKNNNFSYYENVSKTKQLVQITINGFVLFNLFFSLIKDYKFKSHTKHLPLFFRTLTNENLLILLKGLFDADGSKEKDNSSNYIRMNLDSTSKRLILEVKEALMYLNIHSSIKYRKTFIRGKYLCKESYKLRCKPFHLNNINGYFSKITKISKKHLNKVYDISVENDTSYLTSSGVVHNSAGGSYIAYLLNIHCADSIKYGLVFERFHNKLKKSTSDIDSDLLSEGREKIIQYVRNKYGNDNVASISNVNTMTPKVYIRDVARSLELGGSREEAVKVGNNVADTVSAEIKSIDFAYEKVPLFAEYCKKYPEFIKHKNIANQFRNFSSHAAGIVVNRRPLTGLVPLRRDKVGDLILEYDKDKTEENGLVKIDILGLKTLDIIDLTEKLIKKNGKTNPTINVEDNDKKTYNLISSGKCDFVFQLGGSAGTMDLCKKIKPKNIEDLAIITTLARPGCKDIRTDFIKTREGKREVAYSHSRLENALKNTFGFALYDESLLVLAADTAGWDLAKADGLRKLTKLKGSKPKLAMQLHKDFVEGCINNGMEKHDAEFIWINVVEPFGKYSFNKSHAVLYSMISYQTAYYKAHFPIEFLLANLMFEVKSNAPTAKTNIEKIKNEIRERNVKILPPDINNSQLSYTMINDKTLMTGLDALKYVGEDAIKDIIEKRPFTSFQDFMARVSSKHVRANTIQALAASGALDSFCVDGIRRKDILLYCSDYRKKLTAWKKKNDPEKDFFDYPWVNDEDWTLEEKYALEVNYLNEGFICKPYKAYDKFFDGGHYMACHLRKATNKQRLDPLKAIVVDFFCFKVKKEDSKFYGMEMAKLTMEDRVGERYGCTVFPDRWEDLKARLQDLGIAEFDVGLALAYTGSANLYEDNMGVILNGVYDIRNAPAKPEDLSSKKASIRSKKEKKEAENNIIQNANINDAEFEEDITDFLYEEGLLDLDD